MTTFHPARFTASSAASSAAGLVDQLEADAAATPRWSTASAGATTRTTPGELDALGHHLGLCRNLRGPMFLAHCGQQALHRFVAAHPVTTGVLLAGVAGAVWWLG